MNLLGLMKVHKNSSLLVVLSLPTMAQLPTHALCSSSLCMPHTAGGFWYLPPSDTSSSLFSSLSTSFIFLLQGQCNWYQGACGPIVSYSVQFMREQYPIRDQAFLFAFNTTGVQVASNCSIIFFANDMAKVPQDLCQDNYGCIVKHLPVSALQVVLTTPVHCLQQLPQVGSLHQCCLLQQHCISRRQHGVGACCLTPLLLLRLVVVQSHLKIEWNASHTRLVHFLSLHLNGCISLASSSFSPSPCWSSCLTAASPCWSSCLAAAIPINRRFLYI